ncbi:hypothetical protein GUJ93_ZPchr0008g13045 [Zizania palustris]|uniref:Uncharacterized protein n=1 Tax=Zizania palustris TaxID=103762 RepID=A0A8J5RE44_ZIZPA|nr:hypothetical protein GUJ93_ZPchr0008g13045 [Zizania palustris]KAG8047577.1 hypothetical protein GUJ93_ZPchr0008g13045 [Zizania palustris]
MLPHGHEQMSFQQYYHLTQPPPDWETPRHHQTRWQCWPMLASPNLDRCIWQQTNSSYRNQPRKRWVCWPTKFGPFVLYATFPDLTLRPVLAHPKLDRCQW